MEVGSSLQHLVEYDSFFFAEYQQQVPPYLDRLVDSVGHSFLISTSSSFIDLYPEDLFSIDLTTATSDFDFDLPAVDDAPPSPMLQISASPILRCDPGGGSGAQGDGEDWVASQHHSADVASAPWSSAFSAPVSHPAPSTLVSRSPCLTATSKHARPRPIALCAGKRCAAFSPWKVLRFVMPLYRKVRAIARGHSRITVARGATSSVGYHVSTDADIYDAILYCNKSSVSASQQ
ncbi:hypothetical protein ZWY2020_035395 [Hordeum vulgare]|nr:hypothetical protein ZWY2020_035395 [Hordeum vulgare]